MQGRRQQCTINEGAHDRKITLHNELHPEPKSPLSVESFEQFSRQHPELSFNPGFIDSALEIDMVDFLANSSWGSQSSLAQITQPGGFDNVFNPDTASSFNLPFTTPNNYNWLFDLNSQMPSPVPQGDHLMQSNFGPGEEDVFQRSSADPASQYASEAPFWISDHGAMALGSFHVALSPVSEYRIAHEPTSSSFQYPAGGNRLRSLKDKTVHTQPFLKPVPQPMTRCL